MGETTWASWLPGAKADLIVVDLRSLRTNPVDDPIRTLILNTTGANVRDVVINGRFVMRDYTIPGIDTQQLIAEAQGCFNQFKAMHSDYDVQNRPTETFFPTSFPVFEKERN